MTSKIKLAPLSDRVLVKAEEAEQQLESGLYVPTTAQETPQKGRVMRVGPGKIDEKGNKRPMAVKEGDIVIYGKYSGSKIKVGSEEILCMREDDIMAIEE